MAIQPSDNSEKRIELVQIRAKDIHTRFGNPRKITKKEKDKLKHSMETFGDFGIFVVNETDDIIAGNQRLSAVMEIDPDMMLDCKRLVGYTEAELRAINIKANTHSGEWDLEMLATWTADLNLDLDIKEAEKKQLEERKIPEMELIHYEKYNYVMLVCNNVLDYDKLVQKLGIAGGRVHITHKRTIEGRAVWYDQVKDKLFGNSK